MGGIGKTTLARAIFYKFLSEFESHCFLENVRVKSAEADGLSSLRGKLISKLLDQKDNIDWNDAVRRSLQWKRVLIVLDDVNDSKQLKELTGCRLGKGSRIIVTSRDKQVLKSGGILDKHIHEVITLNLEKSLELFSKHAFHQNHPKKGYEELSKMTVAIAQGIPLALEILGSHFYDRDKANWESELKKLKKHPHEQIHNVLRISYDGLSAMDKEIFLDIAFFYMRQPEEKIIFGLEVCGFEAVSGIQNLVNKALIKRTSFGSITMHDLVQEMADQIICNKCSRLKDADQICNILESSKGIDEIEAIVLEPRGKRYPPLKADFFIKMKNLRILKILDHVELPLDLQPFSNKIRCLEWNHYPLESLPSGSLFENLVELHMQEGNFKKLWDGKQDLANLKKINLSSSKQLMELPDLSMAQKLEIVILFGCGNLRSVHPSILSLHSIVRIDVSWCRKLESLESKTHLESLTDFNASHCESLKIFCLSSKKLRSINLLSCEVEILHLPIGRFTELRGLRIDGARLESLPISELCDLTNLEVFKLQNFQQVICTTDITSLFHSWPKLTKLELNGSAVETLPACVNQLSSLTSISLIGCKRLKSILGLPPSIQELCLDGSAVETLPAYVNQLSSLRSISLTGCERLKSILGLPPSIQRLFLDGSAVETLPACVNQLSSLTSIYLRWCKRLKSILGLPPSIQELCLDGSAVETLPACFNQLSSLTSIYLRRCERLKSILGLPPSIQGLCLDGSAVETLPACVNQLSSLTSISLTGCERLKSILGLPPSIQELYAQDCISLVTVPSTSRLQNKCEFFFNNCEMLDKSSIHSIEELTHSSVTLAHRDKELGFDRVAVYPGSKVPKWMKYKTGDSNVIKFTCNLEPSLTLVLCCVVPHDRIPKESIENIYCTISYGNRVLYSCYDEWADYGESELNSDHVFLWCEKGGSLLNNGVGEVDVKFICEFLVSYYCQEEEEEEEKEADLEEENVIYVPAKTCGVHLIYDSDSKFELESESESSWKKRKAVDDDGIISHPCNSDFSTGPNKRTSR